MNRNEAFQVSAEDVKQFQANKKLIIQVPFSAGKKDEKNSPKLMLKDFETKEDQL